METVEKNKVSTIGPKLPLTHYDVLVGREPYLLIFLDDELERCRDDNDVGPFGSPDELFSDNFEQYYKYKIELMKGSLQEMAISNGFSPLSDQDLEVALSQIPEFPHLGPAITADFMSLLNFKLFGNKTFYITSRLIEQLAHTELNAPSEFLKLPFPSCLFVFESRTAIDAMYAMASNDGVSRINNIDNKGQAPTLESYKTPISVFITERPHENGLKKLLISCFHSNKTRNYIHIKRELLIHPEWDIEKSLRTDWGKLYKENPDWTDAIDYVQNGKEPVAVDDECLFYDEGLQFFRIIINTALYLSSNDPDIIECLSPKPSQEARLKQIKSKAKKRKAQNQINKTSELDYSTVGSHLPPIYITKKQSSSNETKESMESSTRFIVRGHWRNQACGKKRTERRLIWIQPYYKGPDMGDIINRPYILQ